MIVELCDISLTEIILFTRYNSRYTEVFAHPFTPFRTVSGSRHNKIFNGNNQYLNPWNTTILEKTGNKNIAQYWGAFVQPLLYLKSKKHCVLWVCICSLRYPALKTHAPYCHLWPVLLYIISPHYLIEGTNLEKKVLNVKHMFWKKYEERRPTRCNN